MFQEPFSYHVIGDIMIWSRDDHLSGRLVYMVNYTSNEPWHINICIVLNESFITCHSGTRLKILKKMKEEESEEKPVSWNWIGYLDYNFEDKVCFCYCNFTKWKIYL